MRLLALVIGVPLATVGVISLSPSWAALPLVGVAVYAFTVSVNKVSHRLAQPSCWTCGHDLAAQPTGEYGVACPDCGSLNQHLAKRELHVDDDDSPNLNA
ncbi:MAG: hypothetical protein EA376_04605 [Phycisphaeraceae bacterium]|nr:MAG: hypothetical protein EA376_04605 [Phycisphaeraceae bacterium]